MHEYLIGLFSLLLFITFDRAYYIFYLEFFN